MSSGPYGEPVEGHFFLPLQKSVWNLAQIAGMKPFSHASGALMPFASLGSLAIAANIFGRLAGMFLTRVPKPGLGRKHQSNG